MLIFMAEMSFKVAAKAFWVGEVEIELRRLKQEDFRFQSDKDLEKYMNMIEDVCRRTIYPHHEFNCEEDASLEVFFKL